MPVQEGPGRVNGLLGNFSLLAIQKSKNFGYFRMFSRLPVEHRTDSYISYTTAQLMRDEAQLIAPGEEAPIMHVDGSEETYNCKRYGIKKAITEEDYDNAGGRRLGPQKMAMLATQQKVMIRNDRIFAANYLATSKWASDQTGKSSNPSTNEFLQWDAASGVTIQKNVEAWKAIVYKNCGNWPNKLGLTPDVYAMLRYQSEIKDSIKYTTSESVSLDILAKFFDVDEVCIVGGAIYNTAKEKATASMAFVATKKALLTYAPKVASTEDLTAGINFAWNRKGKGLNEYGIRIKQWWNEDKECDFVQAESYNDMKLTSAACGLLASDVIA